MEQKKLARIAWNGERVSVDNFCNSKSYRYKSEEERKIINALPYTRFEDVPDIDNGDVYEWYQIGGGKYGRYMYCPKTDILRSQTMAEFYGNSIVD